VTVAGKYTRVAPSPRYRRLVEQYQLMHLQGETRLGIPPERTFPGEKLPKEALRIKRLIKLTGARTILDYGSGKGQQYLPLRITDHEERIEYPDIRSFWGVAEIRCYDPAYAPFAALPAGKFDGVVCTDVLEHCPEEDIPWILDELFAFADKFVYANVACFPARKRLPSGGNAHCTIKPVRWWQDHVERAAKGKTSCYEFRLLYLKAGEIQQKVLQAS
jgi:hypothetical protein